MNQTVDYMPALIGIKNQIDLGLVVAGSSIIGLFVLNLIIIALCAGVLLRSGALRGVVDSHIRVNETMFDQLLEVMKEVRELLHRINGREK